MWRQRLTRRFSQKFRNRENFDGKFQAVEDSVEPLPKSITNFKRRENELVDISQRHLTREEDVRGEELRQLIRNGHPTEFLNKSFYIF